MNVSVLLVSDGIGVWLCAYLVTWTYHCVCIVVHSNTVVSLSTWTAEEGPWAERSSAVSRRSVPFYSVCASVLWSGNDCVIEYWATWSDLVNVVSAVGVRGPVSPLSVATASVTTTNVSTNGGVCPGSL